MNSALVVRVLVVSFLLGMHVFFAPAYSQIVISAGPTTGVQLIPFTVPTCVGNGSTTVLACGINVTFSFLSTQVSSCPSSGQITGPGSVAYGGAGSSASFSNYHTLSYSSTNENQRLSFSSKITKFQFSTSGPAGPAEPFSIKVYDGGVLLNTLVFNVPGQGLRNTYTISGAQFDRVDFIETNSISADDELFGDFYINGGTCTLPMDLLACTALPEGKLNVRLNWSTRNELNVDEYAVLRSADGKDWHICGTVNAKNAQGPNEYSLLDAAPGPNHWFYRIRSRDGDGAEYYHPLIEIELGRPSGLTVYPNPSSGMLNIIFPEEDPQRILRIYTPEAQNILTIPAPGATMQADITELPQGMYFYRIIGAGSGFSGNFVRK